MVILYAIYVLLIISAFAILPLRIRARRRTLKEISKLTAEFHTNAERLIKQVNETTTSKNKINSVGSGHSYSSAYSLVPAKIPEGESRWLAVKVDCWTALTNCGRPVFLKNPELIILICGRNEQTRWTPEENMFITDVIDNTTRVYGNSLPQPR
jgi:hypothetical protein